jgi:hypothetical protein
MAVTALFNQTFKGVSGMAEDFKKVMNIIRGREEAREGFRSIVRYLKAGNCCLFSSG